MLKRLKHIFAGRGFKLIKIIIIPQLLCNIKLLLGTYNPELQSLFSRRLIDNISGGQTQCNKIFHVKASQSKSSWMFFSGWICMKLGSSMTHKEKRVHVFPQQAKFLVLTMQCLITKPALSFLFLADFNLFLRRDSL